MRAIDLISDTIPAIRTSDLGIDALNWMEIFRISHLPIVNNVEFLGLISDTDIYDMNMAQEPIGSHPLSLMKPFVFEDQHIYEVIEVASRLKLTAIPVLDKQNAYKGIISSHNLLQQVGRLVAVENPGGIIVLEFNICDYSLAEVAQIVEANDTKILSCYITSPKDSTKVELTLKLNKIDVTSIIQTFNRYNYTIKASFDHFDTEDTLNQERYEALLNYLSI